MARFLLRNSAPNSRKYHILFLAFIWCLGLWCGIGSCFYAGEPIISLMRMAAGRPVSIVSLLSIALLPFLFSFIFVYLRSWHLLSALCYFKAVLFGFVSAGVYMAFGEAGWLVWLMMMFSDLLCLIPLWWYWISCTGNLFRPTPYFGVCLAAVALIIALDYQFIAPCLVRVILH